MIFLIIIAFFDQGLSSQSCQRSTLIMLIIGNLVMLECMPVGSCVIRRGGGSSTASSRSGACII